jgi:hypothetical protein
MEHILNLLINQSSTFLIAILGSLIGSYYGSRLALRKIKSFDGPQETKPSTLKKIIRWLTYKVDLVN